MPPKLHKSNTAPAGMTTKKEEKLVVTESDGYESDTESDGKSPKSESHVVSFPSSRGVNPDISQSVVKFDENTLKCTVRIGKSRPPTALPKVQGRHVSAYSLMLLVIKNRLEGLDVKEALKEAKSLIKEYIEDDENLKNFFKEFDKLEEKSGIKQKHYEDRLAVYKSELATAKFLAKTTKEALKGADSKILALFDEMKEAHDARKHIGAMDVRNMIKRAQEAYSPFISDLLAITIIIFNRTTDAAKNFPQPSKLKKSDDSSDYEEETTGEAAARSNLEKGKEQYLQANGTLSGNRIARDIAALFDYKHDLVSEEKSYKKDAEAMRASLTRAMCRHLKMAYDAFPFVKEQFDIDANRAVILECFAGQILEKEEWKNHKHADFKSEKKLYERLLKPKALSFEKGKCILTHKSKVKKKHGNIVEQLSSSRGGFHPDTSNLGFGDFSEDSSVESVEEDGDFITMAREGNLPENFEKKFLEILEENGKVDEIATPLHEMEDRELSGETISNDQRFIALLCFLSQKEINYRVDYDTGFIEILSEDDELISKSPIEEITTISSNQNPEAIATAKESRKERFAEILNSEIPVYIPIQIPGHFALLAIDPRDPKTFRYIDSLKDSANGDFPASLIFAAGESQYPYNPQKDLFSDFRATLLERGFIVSADNYVAQQYSKEIHDELIRRGAEAIAGNDDLNEEEGKKQTDELEEETRLTAHNNECGYLVAMNIASMAKKRDIHVNFSAADSDIFHPNPLSFLFSLRKVFDRLFAELKTNENQTEILGDLSRDDSFDSDKSSSEDEDSEKIPPTKNLTGQKSASKLDKSKSTSRSSGGD
jgi:hypothetical protein